MEEQWKRVEELDGWYSVSNMGRVKSHVRQNRNELGQISGYDKNGTGKIIKLSTASGYKVIDSKRIGEKRIYLVHRLVAKYFVPNPEGKPCINHKNFIRHDNRASNIEWCTHQENMTHYWESENALRGQKSPQAKLTKNDVLEMRAAWNLGCFSLHDLYEAYGTSVDNIRHIINRKSWAHL